MTGPAAPRSQADAGTGAASSPSTTGVGAGASSSTSSTAPPAAAAAASGDDLVHGAGSGAVAGDDELSSQFQQLSAAMEARMRMLNQQEEQIRQAEAALSAASRRMSSLSSRMQSDIISLNVGGTHLATSRRTLTLVPDSLLGTMFSGSWDDHLQRDEAGRVFLDYDPSIFSLLLNWLRSQDMGGPEVPLWELAVEAAREEQLLVLIDFLQLQRYVPCRFSESFSAALSSPFLTLSASCAWRTAAGSQGAYAMAATCHCYFDVDVDLHLEVIRFGAVPRPNPVPHGHSSDSDVELPNYPMFVGVMARRQLAELDQSRKKSNASWQSTCHGWWTSRKQGCEVREGRTRRIRPQHLWAESDSLLISLEAAKHPGRLSTPSTSPVPRVTDGGKRTAKGARRRAAGDGGSGGGGSGGGGSGGGGGGLFDDIRADPPGSDPVAGPGPESSAVHPGPFVTLSLTNTQTTDRLQMDISTACLGEFEEQWVVVVGLAGRGDEVRINSARRKGSKPHSEAATTEAAAASASSTARDASTAASASRKGAGAGAGPAAAAAAPAARARGSGGGGRGAGRGAAGAAAAGGGPAAGPGAAVHGAQAPGGAGEAQVLHRGGAGGGRAGAAGG